MNAIKFESKAMNISVCLAFISVIIMIVTVIICYLIKN